MKIVILSQYFDPEPASIQGMTFARWLTARGHEVHVITGFPNYPHGHFYPDAKVAPWRHEYFENVRVSRFILYPSHDASVLRRMLNYLSFAITSTILGTLFVGRPDVVYVYHPPATIGLPAMTWKLLKRAPFVLHVQDLWPESVTESKMAGDGSVSNVVGVAIGWWCRLMYRMSSTVVAISDGMGTILRERVKPSNRVQVIHNWANEELFRPLDRDDELAKALGMDDRFNVVYSGNVGYFQDLFTAVRAAEQLRNLNKFQLVIIGMGSALKELKILATQLELNNVLFIDRLPIEMMPRINALSDILLISLAKLPVFEVTIPSKTQAAMASGRPILLSAIGDSANLVLQSGSGLTCTPGNPEELANAIRELMAMPRDDLERMGQAGFDFYEKNISMDRGMSRLESLLVEAAQTRAKKGNL